MNLFQFFLPVFFYSSSFSTTPFIVLFSFLFLVVWPIPLGLVDFDIVAVRGRGISNPKREEGPHLDFGRGILKILSTSYFLQPLLPNRFHTLDTKYETVRYQNSFSLPVLGPNELLSDVSSRHRRNVCHNHFVTQSVSRVDASCLGLRPPKFILCLNTFPKTLAS